MFRTYAGFNRKAFPWFTPKEPAKAPTVSAEARSDDLEYCEPAAACLNLRVQVLEAAMEFKPKPRTSAKLWEVDSEAISAKGSERGARPV